MSKKVNLRLITTTFLMLFAASALAQMPQESGKIITESNLDGGRIVVGGRYIVANNCWNRGAANGAGKQRIFLEDVNGQKVFGWQWSWSSTNNVVAYPEVICGTKPWDPPAAGLIPELPFQVGTKRITADFDIAIKASGTYNMAFSLWVASEIPATSGKITHEIMIWNDDSGVAPAGSSRGALKVGGTSYDVYVSPGHGDASGKNSNSWTYIAFVAKRPVLRGPLDITAFTDYLVEKGILTKDLYITSLELGNEVVSGTGLVEIGDFDVKIE